MPPRPWCDPSLKICSVYILRDLLSSMFYNTCNFTKTEPMNCLVNLLSRRRKFNIGFHNSVFLFAEKNEWCRLPPSSCSPWTGPPRTPVLIRLVEPSSPVFLRLFESSSCFAPTGFVVGRVIPRWENMVSFLLREPVRVARSRMLCRITTPSHKTWKPIWVFELNILILQKPERPIFVLQNSYF